MQPFKSIKTRRGIVYTPVDVADKICEKIFHEYNDIHSVLEPSAGDGSFVRACIKQGVSERQITAIDLGKVSSSRLKQNYPETKIFNNDFVSFAIKKDQRKFDLVVGNPPYVRRQNFTKLHFKFVSALSEQTGYPLKSLKNAWATFILASNNLLNEKGTLAFIIPYEFLTVSYGMKIQKWLIKEFSRIDVFIPKSKAFPEIDQDAVLLIATKNPKKKAGFFIHHVESLTNIEDQADAQVEIAKGQVSSIELNRALIGNKASQLITNLSEKLYPISHYCQSATGTVTAANEYFILSADEVADWNLESWAEPILKKASFLPNSIRFTKEDLETLSASEPSYLINFANVGSTSRAPEVENYIKHGEQSGFHLRYKCRNRKPWYRVPTTPIAEAYFFKRSHLVPRITLNDAKIPVTDTAYRLIFQEGFSKEGFSYSFYNSLTLLFAEIYGRFYGGGVLELTPLEFKSLPMCYVEPNKKEFAEFENAIKQHLNVPKSIFLHGDKWLQQNLQLSDEEMNTLQTALVRVRKHRIRHGKVSTA